MNQTRNKKTEIDQTRAPVSACESDAMFRWYTNLSGERLKLDFGDLVSNDGLPIPMPVDREGYLPDHDHYYWVSGYIDWLNLQEAIGILDVKPQPGRQKLRLLDVGCATGRVLRHVHIFGHDKFEPWGTDIAPANIAWMKRHFPASIRCTNNTTNAELDFPDEHFDIVTGFSLMPHIDENELAWLQELKRVTHNRGLLYLTVGNESTWNCSAQRENTIKHFENTNSLEGNSVFSKTTFESPLPAARLVRKLSNDPVYNCFIWRSNRYLMETWGEIVEIVRIAELAHMEYQSVVIARP